MKANSVGPVKAGIVGTGMEGRILITQTDPRYLYLTATCDIRPDNREIGNAMVRDPKLGHNPAAKAYQKFEDMLADADIEAVIIATPLHTHGPLAIQALKAGKHVFVEKTMAYTLDECLEMIRLAKEKNLNLQIGHQRFYNPLYWDAFNMVKEGLIGNVYHIPRRLAPQHRLELLDICRKQGHSRSTTTAAKNGCKTVWLPGCAASGQLALVPGNVAWFMDRTVQSSNRYHQLVLQCHAECGVCHRRKI